MAAVIRRSGALFILVAALILVGCSSERDRQWYKPATNYTVAEFTRDRDECTKARVLDEQCMKQKGWVPLTADRDPSKTPPAVNPRGGRY
ncbi:MAG TPA: hypothetical protein VK878_13320 [Candidatus Deferrimicrobiaceae bacterium]|nr:hypothetical protein [Candidatus Deferrimicrobiaceae bacterium]